MVQFRVILAAESYPDGSEMMIVQEEDGTLTHSYRAPAVVRQIDDQEIREILYHENATVEVIGISPGGSGSVVQTGSAIDLIVRAILGSGTTTITGANAAVCHRLLLAAASASSYTGRITLARLIRTGS